ncbi:MAG: DNA methyltransferase [Pontixanthobacter sp.]
MAIATKLAVITIRNIEHGAGSIRSLTSAIKYLELRFVDQPLRSSVSAWIRSSRKRGKLSQAKLAALCDLSVPTISKVENGGGNIETLLLILAVLNLKPKLVIKHQVRNGINLIHGDCVEVMDSMPRGSIQLVVTSPPYLAGKSYEVDFDFDQHIDFISKWLGAVEPLITKNGAMWINIGYIKNLENEAIPLPYLYYPVLKKLGLKIVQEVIWHYEGGLSYKKRFSHRTERWLWVVRDTNAYVFNLDEVRDRQLNITNDKRNNVLGKNPTDYWYFERVVGGRGSTAEKTTHPAQFPVLMIERILASCSDPDDLVLDCFSGSGSTGEACIKMRRQFIGIERKIDYVEIARQRLSAFIPRHSPSLAKAER